MDFSDPAALQQALSCLGATDTDQVKAAEDALRPFTKKVECIPVFLGVLQSCENKVIRLQAGLMLKSKLGTLFAKCDVSAANQVKVTLLQLIVAEPEKSVRNALAGCVSCIAKRVLAPGKKTRSSAARGNGEWPELFALLMQLASNTDESLRALTYSLLTQLSEQVSTQLKSHVQTMCQMFISGCQDHSPIVSSEAMGACSTFMMNIIDTPDVMQMQPVLTPMMGVLQGCLQRGDDDLIEKCLEVFSESVQSDQPLINEHIPPIIPILVGILQDGEDTFQDSTKQVTGQLLMNVIEHRPKLLAKQNLVVPVLEALISIVAKFEGSGTGDVYSSLAINKPLDEGIGKREMPRMPQLDPISEDL